MPRRRPRRRRLRPRPAADRRPEGPAPAAGRARLSPRTPPEPAPAPTAPGPEEARLLALARALGDAAADAGATAALRALLPDRRRASPGNETRTLAISWAREQARLALEEALARIARGGRRAAPRVPLPLLSWLLVAATDAFPTEPAEAVGERLAALADLIAADEPRRW